MRARRAHDARTHDANTAPHRHANIETAAARPLDAYLSARSSSQASRVPDEAAGADAASQPLHTCVQEMGRNKTASGRVISGMDNLGIRWSLSIGALYRRLLRPSDTYVIRKYDKGCIFRVIRSPPSTRPQTTSRGPTTVRSGDMDQPNSPTPWHHHGTHTWWRPPPPRPLVRRRKRLGQLPREVPEVLSDSRRAGRHRRALAAAAAPSPERTHK